jgi:hypothetical protein
MNARLWSMVPLPTEEVSKRLRQTNSAAAIVVRRGYRDWLARVVNANMAAETLNKWNPS